MAGVAGLGCEVILAEGAGGWWACDGCDGRNGDWLLERLMAIGAGHGGVFPGESEFGAGVTGDGDCDRQKSGLRVTGIALVVPGRRGELTGVLIGVAG